MTSEHAATAAARPSTDCYAFPEFEAAILYDCMDAMNKAAEVIVPLLNEHGTPEQVQAYKSGVYASSMKLGMLIGVENLDRQKQRHEEIARRVQDFVDRRKSEA